MLSKNPATIKKQEAVQGRNVSRNAKQQKMQVIFLSALTLVLFGLMAPSISMAQQYSDPGQLQSTISGKPEDYQAPGARVGSFILKPGVEIAWEDNDNIFYLNKTKISDSIIHIRPWANLSSDWNRHELNLAAYADFGKYDKFSSQDYEDFMFNLDGRVDVKRGSYISYNASYLDLHEDRSSPDGSTGSKTTEFNITRLSLGYTHTFNRMKASLEFDTAESDYDNNLGLSGAIIDNQDRDRTGNSLTLRLDYEMSPGHGLFISAKSNELDYDQNLDSDGFRRSSDGGDLRMGLSWDITGVVSGELFGQYIDQDYDDPRLNSIDGFGLGASLDWTPTKLTKVNVRFANQAQETTQVSTSGYFSRLVSVRVQHEFRRNLLANVRYSLTDNNYEVSGGTTESLNYTEVNRASIGLSYLFNRNASLSGGFIVVQQDANTSSFEYETERWFMTFGIEF
jgi:hypothetical protein